jgi:hypothetical protein
MTKISLTRRQLAQMALTGAAAALIPATVQAQDTGNTTMPTPNTPGEGIALASVVPLNVGYALTETQAKEVAAALKDYPAAFSKVRAYGVPDDVAPAWAGIFPPARTGKGRA